MEIGLWINLVYLIPIGLLVRWIQTLSIRISEMSKTQQQYYTKQETKEMIALNMEPVKVKLDAVEQNTSEIKQMLTVLVNERK